ncbi:MAG: TraB/GumN family protein [Bacteroidota bacterium]
MRIYFLLIAILVAITFKSHAQKDKPNYALLWEITSDALENPSYLFGTMHVKDKRAAAFPDSLLIALQQTEAYAMEVHPDTMIDFMMQLMFAKDTSNILKEKLSVDAYERLNQAVIEKTGKPIEELENQDPSFIELLLTNFDEPDYTEKNDQMLDLYFYKQAWAMEKPIYGLEEFKDYENVTKQFFGLFEEEISNVADEYETSDEQFEDMIAIYQAGDLEALHQWMQARSTGEDFDRAMLDDRNQKMVKSIGQILKNQSCFFAVGAAHLPGEMGMINLLRAAGYQVRKVKATFKEDPKKYDAGEGFDRWQLATNKRFGYELKLPSKAYNVNNLVEGNQINFNFDMSFNMLDMSGFLIIGIVLPGVHKKSYQMEDMLELVDRYGDGADREMLEKKSIRYKGLKGGQFRFREEDGAYTTWRVFIRDGLANLFGVYGENVSFKQAAVQYFYKNINFQVPKMEDRSNADHLLYSSNGAYQILMPFQPTYKRTVQSFEIEEGVEREVVGHIYYANDFAANSLFLVQHNYLALGMYVEDQEVLLQESINRISAERGTPESVKDIRYEGLPGKEVLYILEQQNLYVRILLRGNRTYLLLAFTPKKKERMVSVNAFFNSFQLRTPLEMQVRSRKLEPIKVSMDFPSQPIARFEKDEGDYPQLDEWEYIAQDTLNGYSYTLMEYHYPPYYQVADMDSFLNNYGENLKSGQDYDVFLDTTFQGKRAWYTENEADSAVGVNYALIFLAGERLYELAVYAPVEEDKKRAWRFFNSFQSDENYQLDYFTSDRSELLLKNIQSKDSSTQLAAKQGIDRYEMSVTNLPMIYKILEQDYPFDTLHDDSIHDLMFQELLYTSDENTLPFLAQLFQKRAGKRLAQASILEVLSDMKNEAAYDLFFELAPHFKGAAYDEYGYSYVIESMRDTVALTAKYYTDIRDLGSNKALRYYTYNLIFHLLRADALDKEAIAKDQSIYLQAAKAIVEKYDLKEAKKTLPEMEEYWELDALHVILGELPAGSAIDQYLLSMLSLPDANLVAVLIDALLLHNQKIPVTAFEAVFADPYRWKQLLSDLQYEKHLEFIPSHFLTQKATVRAYVQHYLEDEYGTLSKFDFIEKRDFEWKGKPLNLYLYTFALENYEGTFLGVCSQPKSEKEIEISPTLFDYSGQAYVAENKEALLEEILADWEE